MLITIFIYIFFLNFKGLKIKTMEKTLFITSILSLSTIFSCGNESKGTLPKQENKEIKNETSKTNFIDSKKCKALFVMMEDRSGSTSDHRKLSKQDYSELIHSFMDKNYGQFAVRVIGNPRPDEREFYILRIKPFKNYITVPKSSNAKMSEIQAAINKNKKIKAENENIQKQNDERVNNFIENVISKHIIAYKPYKRDLTDIEEALTHLQIKTSEAIFNNHPIDVLIISDGKHDATRLKHKLTYVPKNNINLYLIGWKDKSVFSKINKIDEYDSFDSFIEAYEETNHCNK